jgi:hypothetical protein
VDLLHVLNNQEITTLELKESLIMINKQKKQLKKDQQELNRLSLVAVQMRMGLYLLIQMEKFFGVMMHI